MLTTHEVQGQPIKPFLRYAGGKAKYVSLFEQFYDRKRRYVSLFCGALGDVLGLRPERALLNDSFAALINLYEWVQRGFYLGDRRIVHSPARYYQARDRFNEIACSPELLKKNSQEAAELLFYLNRHCFNGLIRAAKKGNLNMPIGKPSKEDGVFWYPPHLFEYREILSGWELSCKDFSEVEIEKNDYVYADPPYEPLTPTSKFTEYGNGKVFDWKRQVELAEFLSELKVPVVASNHATTRILELYSQLGFNYITFPKSRPINSKGSALDLSRL